jgi:RNA polymerase sigma-70 factor (ECF subfamily)
MTETPKLDSRAAQSIAAQSAAATSADATSADTEQVWRALHADLRRFLLRRVGREDLADDLLQEVFLRIHRRLDGLADIDRLHGWVFRIAGNVVIDHYRAAGKREKPAAAEAIDATAASTDEAGDESEMNAEVAGWLASMVEHLPETHREAVRLAELERVPQTEIARRLGLSVSGAKSRVQRGRELLKASLDRCCRFELDQRGNILDYTQQQPCGGCCGEKDCTST